MVRKRRLLILGVIAVIVGAGFFALVSGGWTEGYSIDVSSGQKRWDLHFFRVRVWGWRTDTSVSRMYRRLIGKQPVPRWRTESLSYWPGGDEVAYAWGNGALEDVERIGKYLESEEFTDDARRAVILEFISLLSAPHWPETTVWEYEDRIAALIAAKRGGKITAAELPAP